MIGSSSAAPWESDEQRLQADAADFTWMVSRFAEETAGVVDAIAVSSDGLLIAVSRPQDPGSSERLAAVVSGMTSLAAGAAGNYGLGALNKVIIDMEGGYLLIARIGSGAVLGAVTTSDAKLANVAYEMTLFANRVGTVLSPQLIVELKNTVATGTAAAPIRRQQGAQG
jgi:predicted regulator of Ras-like GTPase activity (Roadblock/LC7/MglB family)